MRAAATPSSLLNAKGFYFPAFPDPKDDIGCTDPVLVTPFQELAFHQ
ncbi:hypothetical protein J2S89_001964 [Arthrobacter bambusae]|nr:hypothetical protein [Arthrobacter bambusae]MDQ0030139.1 hypothetical protein [Arthrobacter bambusae]MDQ0097822.1 hypothetical protein [Arthrobacter bambusae]